MQAFARRLEQDRERRVLRRHRQQIGGPLTLLPQGRAPVWAAARQQQGTSRAFTKARREQRRLRQRAHHQFVDVVGIDDQLRDGHVVGGLGQTQHDAVVAPHRLDRHVEALDQPALDGHRPRSMHRRAERSEDAHPPVADLVAEPLDDHGAIIRNDTGGLNLLVEVRHHVAGGKSVEVVLGHQAVDRRLAAQRPHFSLERTQCPTQLQRSARAIAVPERHLALLARRRGDDDPLERDLLDSPCAGTEQERLARPALVHHLLVELAHACAIGQEDPEQAAVGDGATARDSQPLRAVAGAQRAGGAIPDQPWPQFVELVAGIATRQQVEDVVQEVVAELGEVGAAPYHGSNRLDRAFGMRRDVGDDLLCEHVEGIAQEARGLDLASDHPLGHHGSLEQVAAMLWIQGAATWFAHRVSGSADALHAA